MRPLIIERPDLETAAQRIGKVSVTLVCWVVWMYLFVPLVSLAAWAASAALSYDVIVVQLSVDQALERAESYAHIILILAIAFISWAGYNYLRWRGVERRAPPAPVDIAELSDSFSTPVERVKELQAAKIVTLTETELSTMFDEHEEGLLERLNRSDLEDSLALSRTDKAA